MARRIVPVLVVDPREIQRIKSAGKNKDPFEQIYKKYGVKDPKMKELSARQVASIEKKIVKREMEEEAKKPKKSKKVPSLIKKLEKNRKKQEEIMEKIYKKYGKEEKKKRKSSKKKKSKSPKKRRTYKRGKYNDDASCRSRKQQPKKYICRGFTKKGTACTFCTDDDRKYCKLHL